MINTGFTDCDNNPIYDTSVLEDLRVFPEGYEDKEGNYIDTSIYPAPLSVHFKNNIWETLDENNEFIPLDYICEYYGTKDMECKFLHIIK